MDEAKERLIPAILLAVGLAVFVVYGFVAGGATGAVAVLLLVGVQLTLAVVLGLVACAIVAKVLATSFGYLGSATLKLAAVILFPSALTILIPSAPLAWAVSLILFLSLLVWLFDLEPLELIVCAVVIWLVRAVAFFLGALAFAA